MTRYVIRATADDGCAVSVDLTGDQYLAVRHIAEGIQAQPGYTPSMSIHLPEDFADTYGDSYGPVVDLGPVPAQVVVPHSAFEDEPDYLPPDLEWQAEYGFEVISCEICQSGEDCALHPF